MLISRRRFLAAGGLTLVSATSIGCGRNGGNRRTKGTKQQNSSSPFKLDEEPAWELALVIDISGSFEDLWYGKDGRAFKFCMKLIDSFFRQRIGNNDRLLIAAISGEDKMPIIYEGSPKTFRKKFNPASFRDHLKAKCPKGGSRCHDTVSDVLDYLVRTRPKLGAGTMSLCATLSDMDNNIGDDHAAERRLVKSMSEFGKRNGYLAFYWVRQDLAPRIVDLSHEAGYEQVICRCDFEDRDSVPFPNFKSRP